VQQLIVSILVVVAVLAWAAGIALLLRRRRRAIRKRLAPDAAERRERRGGSRTLGLVRRFGGTFSPKKKPSNALQAKLRRGGYYGPGAAATFIGVKILLFGIALVVTAFFVLPLDLKLAARIYLVLLAGAAMFFLPNLVLRARQNRRREEIRRHLPDAIDLLEICVSTGMGLDMAWNSVSDEIRGVSRILSDEMELTNLEMQLGASRADAMRGMSVRTGADEVASLAALLVQSDRFGTSVSDALSTFASSMRERRSLYAEERAEKTAVALLFPLVLFIFPVMLIVTVGPAIMTLVDMLSG
jgi:tight adherence protein C